MVVEGVLAAERAPRSALAEGEAGAACGSGGRGGRGGRCRKTRGKVSKDTSTPVSPGAAPWHLHQPSPVVSPSSPSRRRQGPSWVRVSSPVTHVWIQESSPGPLVCGGNAPPGSRSRPPAAAPAADGLLPDAVGRRALQFGQTNLKQLVRNTRFCYE